MPRDKSVKKFVNVTDKSYLYSNSTVMLYVPCTLYLIHGDCTITHTTCHRGINTLWVIYEELFLIFF